MSIITFENYGKFAECCDDYTVISGRYKIQAEAEKQILADVVSKLDLKPSDSVLEIGCGAGNLLIPLSFIVKDITGLDHFSCIELIKRRFPDSRNMRLQAGNFLNAKIAGSYNKILCYSVIHCLQSEEELISFINKALELLSAGGRLLVGDIPNRSLKERFILSKRGQQFNREWQELVKSEKTDDIPKQILPKDDKLLQCDDGIVLRLLKHFRELGYHTYVLPQPQWLPFGNTREDVLIVKID